MSTHPDNPSAYPLAWPRGVQRANGRIRARFGSTGGGAFRNRRELTISEGVRRVLAELDRLGVGDWRVIISSNVKLRRDGLPRGASKNPEDPGVAVYFWLDDEPMCMACDRWDRVADNLAAVAKTLDAKRGIARWGVGSVADHFKGFRALPAVGETTEGGGRAWWIVLDVQPDADLDAIRLAFKRRSLRCHPDTPSGSSEAWIELQEAKRQAEDARRSPSATPPGR